jgi:hypothetical protein
MSANVKRVKRVTMPALPPLWHMRSPHITSIADRGESREQRTSNSAIALRLAAVVDARLAD